MTFRPLLFLTAAAIAACEPADGLPTACPGCNLIIVDLGEVRVDRLGLGGAVDDPMPTLSALAARGLSFEAAQGVANWWGPAQTAVATGLAPWVSEVMYTPKDPKPAVAAGLPVMASALSARGWETAGVMGWALPGTSDGFDRFNADKGAGLPEAAAWIAELTASERYLLVARASLGQGLVWNGQSVNLRSLREGVLTADEYRQAYDQRLRAIDADLAALMSALAASGEADRTWVVVLGEHGGSYGDLAGEPWVAEAVTSDAVARVPLVWVGPTVPRGTLSYPVSVLDVLHTALAALEDGLPAELTSGDLRAGPPAWVGMWSARGGVETRFGEAARAPAVGVSASAWFAEEAAARGIAAAGPSAGLAWGDVNGDRRPDLWVGNHGEPGTLWVQVDGGFVDGSGWVDAETRRYDDHGAAWADLDGDGDDDLIELVGAQGGKGVGSNRVWVNEGATASDRAAALGLDLPMERGRSPLWVDLDGDGWLDLIATAHARRDRASGAAFLLRRGGVFEPSASLPRVNSTMVVMLDAAGDEAPEVVIAGPRFPELIVAPRSQAVVEWEARRAIAVREALTGDVDGDGREDVVLLQTEEGDAVEVVDGNTVEAAVRVDGLVQVRVAAAGRTCVEIQPWTWSKVPLVVGAGGVAASGVRCFEPDAAEVQGVSTLPSGGDPAVGIGRVAEGQWVVSLDGAAAGQATVRVTAEGGVDDAELVAASAAPAARRLGSVVWRRGEAGLEPWPEPALATVRTCASGALADFDNDMDLDLYLACTGGVKNQVNLVLENDGTGRFIRRTDPAAGVPDGRSGEVAAADFDGDGFVDLAIVNGHGSRPFNDGPVQLLHNVGNGNHWLEIELVDAAGDRRAVGAVVWVEAGGRRQVRVSDGGVHRWAQDHDLLHVGLGPNVRADLEVRWPDGQRTTVSGVAADQVVRVGRGGLVE